MAEWPVDPVQPAGPGDAAATVSRTSAFVALHLAVALFGLAGLFGKWLTLSPLVIVLGRTVVAALALALVARLRNEPLGHIEPSLLLNGAILALHWVTFFLAIQLATVATGLLGYATFPLFTLLLGHRGRLRTIPRSQWLAILLVLAGFAVLVPTPTWSDTTVQGLAMGAVSGLTFAWLALRNQAMLARYGPVGLAFWQNGWAAIWLMVIVVPIAGVLQAPTWTDIGALITLGALCTAVAHTLFIGSLRRVPAHVASVVAALEPVYGIAFAVVLAHEVPTMREIGGAVLLLSAAVIASAPPRGAPS
jgi:drug/metabolite transporter (DMT)-like permease